MTDYLTLHDVLGIHEALLQRYGGAVGVRDPGAIEAALFRPRSGYYATIVEEAAAILESLLLNQPFTAGNERTAIAACDVFLRINGHRLEADPSWMRERVSTWLWEKDGRLRTIIEDLRHCLNK